MRVHVHVHVRVCVYKKEDHMHLQNCPARLSELEKCFCCLLLLQVQQSETCELLGGPTVCQYRRRVSIAL